MAFRSAPRAAWRRMINRRLGIPATLFFLAFGVMLTTPHRLGLQPAAQAQTTGYPAFSPPRLSSLPPCPTPGPYTAANATPPHPPQAGDKFCDARSFGRSVPGTALPHRNLAATQLPPRLSSAADQATTLLDTLTGPAVQDVTSLVCPAQTFQDVSLCRTDVQTQDEGYYGLQATRDVVDVTLGSTDEDAFYDAMHQLIASAGNWAEVGWLYLGTAWGGVNCAADTYLVYTYDPTAPKPGGGTEPVLTCYTNYSIGPGNQVALEIASYYANPPPPVWGTWIFWDGAWQGLYEKYDMSSTEANASVSLESWTAKNNLPNFLSYPSAGSSGVNGLYGVSVIKASLTEGVFWTPANVPTVPPSADSPYMIDVTTPYDRWAGCGPTPPTGPYTC